jgi:DNA-binding CsgD family transcriptional regulator
MWCNPGMQPSRPNDGADVSSSDPLLVSARDAWFRGDCERSLELISRCSPRSDVERREALLIRARALLRLRRFDEAVATLGPNLTAFVEIDDACTARMLHATGVAVSQEPDRGLALLYDVATSARTLGAHAAIVAEIEYNIAYAHWLKREYDAVLEHAILSERAGADVISVRAASLRGFVALAKERYHKALKLFRWALDAYRLCRQRDGGLAEQLVVQIAALEVALQSVEVPGTHTAPPAFENMLGSESSSRVPGVARMQIASLDSWLYAFEGDQQKAYDRARISDRLAPSPAWLTWSLANRAQIAAAFGDSAWARAFATDAVEIAGTVDWNETTDEQRVGLLLLAEALAGMNAPVALTVLERYETLTSDIDRARLFHDDVRLWILETFVRGLANRMRGNSQAAWHAFKDVHAAASRVKILWRAALALIELDATPAVAQRHGEHYLQEAGALIRENFPRSFLARRLGRWMNTYDDLVVARLAPQPREVLRHFLRARSAKEVAAIMGLSQHTVKDYTETLFRAFGVHSKEELLVTCYDRGVGSPSWWNVPAEPKPSSIVVPRSSMASADATWRRSRSGTEGVA